jgi:hypothetical protein
MKTIVLTISLLILASCSTSRIHRKIDDVTWDSLADESYLRWVKSVFRKKIRITKLLTAIKVKRKTLLRATRKNILQKARLLITGFILVTVISSRNLGRKQNFSIA